MRAVQFGSPIRVNVPRGKERKRTPRRHLVLPERRALARQWALVDHWRCVLHGTKRPHEDPRGADDSEDTVHDAWFDYAEEGREKCPNSALTRLLKQFDAAAHAVDQDSPLCAVDDGDDEFRRQPVLDLVAFCLELGHLPPLEYLLALLSSIERYRAGECSLEEAFYDRPAPRVGTRARRLNQADGRDVRATVFAMLRHSHKNDVSAAQAAIDRLGLLGVEPESFLRDIKKSGIRAKPRKSRNRIK